MERFKGVKQKRMLCKNYILNVFNAFRKHTVSASY